MGKTKAKKRAAETREFRRALIREVGRCEMCGVNSSGWLACHEIARGPNRQAALDKRFAILVLCWICHCDRVHGNEDWPEARQLAVLKRSRPKDYDLVAYNELIGRGPKRITEEDVDAS